MVAGLEPAGTPIDRGIAALGVLWKSDLKTLWSATRRFGCLLDDDVVVRRSGSIARAVEILVVVATPRERYICEDVVVTPPSGGIRRMG